MTPNNNMLMPINDHERELSIHENVPSVTEDDTELLVRKSIAASRANLVPGQSMEVSEQKALQAFMFELNSYQSSLFKSTEEFQRVLGNNTLVLRIPVSRWAILTGTKSSNNSAHKRKTLQALSKKQFMWEEDAMLPEHVEQDFEYENLFLSAGIVDRHVVFKIPPQTRCNLLVEAKEPAYHLNFMSMNVNVKHKYVYLLYDLFCQHIDLTTTEKQVKEFSITQDDLLKFLKVEYTPEVVKGRIRPKFAMADSQLVPSKVKEKIIDRAIKKIRENHDVWGVDASVSYKHFGAGETIYSFHVIYTPSVLKANNEMLFKYKEEMTFIQSCFDDNKMDRKNRGQLEGLAKSNETELLYIYDCWKRTYKASAKSKGGYFLTVHKQNTEYRKAIAEFLRKAKDNSIEKRQENERLSISQQQGEEFERLKKVEAEAALAEILKEGNEPWLEKTIEGFLQTEPGIALKRSLASDVSIVDILDSGMGAASFRGYVFDHCCSVTKDDIWQRVKGMALEGEVDKPTPLDIPDLTKLKKDIEL